MKFRTHLPSICTSYVSFSYAQAIAGLVWVHKEQQNPFLCTLPFLPYLIYLNISNSIAVGLKSTSTAKKLIHLLYICGTLFDSGIHNK